MKVTLRKRKLKTGNTSLYLDIYANSKRQYEYLNLYLKVAKSQKDRDENKKALQLAEAVRGERLVEIQNGTFGFKTEANGDRDFLAFYADLAEGKRELTDSTHKTWGHTLKHLRKYTNNSLQFKDVNETLLEGFKNYLLTQKVSKSKTRLAQNSAAVYFNKLRTAVNKAYDMGLITRNPIRVVKAVKQSDGKREYLTMEEVKKLSETDCNYEELKRAFLFSVLTGLRWSDIDKLIWGEIKQSEQMGSSIMFRQQKTDGQEYLPISEQALSLLGDRGADHDKVFADLKYSAYMSKELVRWVLKAGITKDITFHCARHTHATLLLTNGIDLYTVSKLLGHKDIKTTQIYAKVIDQKKVSAVNSIPNFL